MTPPPLENTLSLRVQMGWSICDNVCANLRPGWHRAKAFAFAGFQEVVG